MGARIQINKGDQYSRLTILEEVEQVGPRRYFKCLCSCGNITITRIDSLRNGHTQSCGCYNVETSKNVQIKNCFIHGKSRTYLHNTWTSMKQRCLNPNHPKYKDYGKRGIYEPWINNYELFEEYILINLGERPDGFSLDRIQNNIGYFPGNLRWADDITQANNRKKRGPKTPL